LQQNIFKTTKIFDVDGRDERIICGRLNAYKYIKVGCVVWVNGWARTSLLGVGAVLFFWNA